MLVQIPISASKLVYFTFELIEDEHHDEAQEWIINYVILSPSILKMYVILEGISHEAIYGNQVAKERYKLSP